MRKPHPVTGKLVTYATPLFLALALIEFADLVFAIDSVPAIFAITTDPFIVYTSNIFAILGLRALYFALAAMVHRFYYLKYALAAVLIFIGGKVFLADMLGIDKIPPVLSLIVTFANFDIVRILTSGGPVDQTHVFATWAFNLGIQSNDIPLGASVSLFMLPILGIAAIFILRGVTSRGNEA